MKKHIWIFTTLFLLASTLGIAFLFQERIQRLTLPRSILIVAVDDFSTFNLTCQNDSRPETRSGITTLCQEALRFTHAYTTSTLSLPALTSVLTGLYPFQHLVRDNGPNYLSNLITTFPERAYQLGYRTSFWSGGAPVLRRSGLNQGVQLFRDYFQLSSRKIHKPFSEIISEFNSWLKDIKSAPFVSIIYLPDLIFLDRVTVNPLGEARSKTYESQLEEFDENLFRIISELKSKGHWERTDFFLVGLNGRTRSDRKLSSPSLNLLSDSSQIPLLWKQANNKIAPLEKTRDKVVTLADLGATLFRLLGDTVPEDLAAEFPVRDLESKNLASRFILTESSWATWKNLGPTRYALRKDHLVYVHDEIPRVYNSLTDRLENEPLVLMDPSVAEFSKAARRLVLKHQWPAFKISGGVVAKAPNQNCLNNLRNGRNLKTCEDQIYFELLAWQNSEKNLQADPGKKELSKRRFVKHYQYYLADQKLREVNEQLGYLWDVTEQDNLVNQALDLPQFQNIKSQVLRAINQTAPTFEEDL